MEDVVKILNKELKLMFNNVIINFNIAKNELEYKPINNGWSIKEILEHISLTNYYLLILVRKGVEKSLTIANKNEIEFGWRDYKFNWEKLNAIGQHNSFLWNRPEHMEPTNTVELEEIKDRIVNQLEQCLDLLMQIKNGEGILYKTTMSVNGLGKIDVYHYIYFIVQHNKRHLQQIKKIKIEINNENNNTTNT